MTDTPQGQGPSPRADGSVNLALGTAPGCPTPEACVTLDLIVALKPIKLRLDGEDIHLVPTRELDRWGGFLNGPRGAYTLITPDNIAEIRHALMCRPAIPTEGVYTELRKQLEDGSALFFEVPPKPVAWDSIPEIDIHDLIPGGDDTDDDPRPGPDGGLHWIEIVCISAEGGSYAGAKARVRLPDGRSEYLALDGRSSVRFDDLTEGGTVHFELSGDAIARGTLQVPVGTRYELGAPIGLTTRKQHVLIVHPNPRAFVSVELFVEDEPVTVGKYTLRTKAGDQSGALEGEVARADGFVLPSTASYSFEQVILPPRPAEDADDIEDDPSRPEDIPEGPIGGDPITHEPTPPLAADALRVTLRLADGTPIPATITLSHASTEDAEGDEAEFNGVNGNATLTAGGFKLPE